MSKIKATTFVLCPVGTTIELYTDTRPTVGETFKVRHIDTGEVVQEAKVTSVEHYSDKAPEYRVLATII